jgi:hypothetical protein
MLKAILNLPLTGDLWKSSLELQSMLDYLFQRNNAKNSGYNLLKQDFEYTMDDELGLVSLMDAEVLARRFGWCRYPEPIMDKTIADRYKAATVHFSSRFERVSPSNDYMHFNKMEDDTELDRWYRESYTTTMTSYANFLLSIPREEPNGVFGDRELFMISRFQYVALGGEGPQPPTECEEPLKYSLGQTQKNANTALDNCLKMNRALFPDDKMNPKAGWILLALGCSFGDMRDYMYATGLLNSAKNTFFECYGEYSEEYLHLLQVEERMFRGLGSTEEAETRKRRRFAIINPS